jgi:hypothetical protein
MRLKSEVKSKEHITMALQWQLMIPKNSLDAIVSTITLGELGNKRYAEAAQELLEAMRHAKHVYDSHVDNDMSNVYLPASLTFVIAYIRGTLMGLPHNSEKGMTSQFFLMLADEKNHDELLAADKLLGYQAAGTLKLRGQTGHTHRVYAIHPRRDGGEPRIYISDARGRYDVYKSFQAALEVHEPVQTS